MRCCAPSSVWTVPIAWRLAGRRMDFRSWTWGDSRKVGPTTLPHPRHAPLCAVTTVNFVVSRALYSDPAFQGQRPHGACGACGACGARARHGGAPRGSSPGAQGGSGRESTIIPLEHLGDLVKCPVERGVFISESIFGTQQNVLNTEVSLFQWCPFERGSTVALVWTVVGEEVIANVCQKC